MALLLGLGTVAAFQVYSAAPHLLLVACIFGGWGMIKTPMITIVGQNAPPASRGAAVGMLMGCMSLGFATGPIVSGALYNISFLENGKGYSDLPFIVGFVVACISALNIMYVKAQASRSNNVKEVAEYRPNESNSRFGLSTQSRLGLSTQSLSAQRMSLNPDLERLSYSGYGSAI